MMPVPLNVSEAGQMPTLRELEDWMTSGQVAGRLGVTRQTALNLARHELRAVLVGRNHEGRGTWIYDPKDVERYASERSRP